MHLLPCRLHQDILHKQDRRLLREHMGDRLGHRHTQLLRLWRPRLRHEGSSVRFRPTQDSLHGHVLHSLHLHTDRLHFVLLLSHLLLLVHDTKKDSRQGQNAQEQRRRDQDGKEFVRCFFYFRRVLDSGVDYFDGRRRRQSPHVSSCLHEPAGASQLGGESALVRRIQLEDERGLQDFLEQDVLGQDLQEQATKQVQGRGDPNAADDYSRHADDALVGPPCALF